MPEQIKYLNEPASLPEINSDRLMGLEIEMDAGNQTFNEPCLPRGWVSKADGSLRNGQKYVLEPGVKWHQLKPFVISFDEACVQSQTYMGKRGGYHVHVQSHDLSIDDCWVLVQLYSHYQISINSLLAESRHNNTFCPPYPANMTKTRMVNMFSLDHPAANRQDAKSSRCYSVVNLAMHRCSTPAHRSIEFRQASPSRKTANVYGWAAFCLALVEIAKNHHDLANTALTTPNYRLSKLLKSYEQASGNAGVAEWALWRYRYMNTKPTEEMITKAVTLFGRGSRGVFGIAKDMDIHNGLAKRILEAAAEKGLISKSITNGVTTYKCCYSAIVDRDLSELQEAFAAFPPLVVPDEVEEAPAPIAQRDPDEVDEDEEV